MFALPRRSDGLRKRGPGRKGENARYHRGCPLERSALDEDIELCATKDYTLLNVLGGRSDLGLLRSETCTDRCVYQDGMVYFRWDKEAVSTDGKPERDDLLRGYDGQTTRTISGMVGHIINARANYGGMLVPHNMVIRTLIQNFPLSDFLHGGRAARRSPGFKDAEITVTYEGDDVVDGLRCHRLKILYALDSWKNDGRGPTVRFLWIAP